MAGGARAMRWISFLQLVRQVAAFGICMFRGHQEVELGPYYGYKGVPENYVYYTVCSRCEFTIDKKVK